MLSPGWGRLCRPPRPWLSWPAAPAARGGGGRKARPSPQHPVGVVLKPEPGATGSSWASPTGPEGGERGSPRALSGSPASPTASLQGPRRRCSASLPPTQAQRLSTKSSGPQSHHTQPGRGTSARLRGSCQGQRARLQERPAPGGEQPCTSSPTRGVLLGRLPLKMGAHPGPGPRAPLSPAAVRQTLSSAQTRQMDWPGGWSPRHTAPSNARPPGNLPTSLPGTGEFAPLTPSQATATAG